MSLLGTNILVFGGLVGGITSLSNDLCALNLSELQSHADGASWETLMPNEPHPNRPPPRKDHTMVSWDNKLYL